MFGKYMWIPWTTGDIIHIRKQCVPASSQLGGGGGGGEAGNKTRHLLYFAIQIPMLRFRGVPLWLLKMVKSNRVVTDHVLAVLSSDEKHLHSKTYTVDHRHLSQMLHGFQSRVYIICVYAGFHFENLGCLRTWLTQNFVIKLLFVAMNVELKM